MSKTVVTFEMQSGEVTEFACYEEHGTWGMSYRILGRTSLDGHEKATECGTSKRQRIK